MIFWLFYERPLFIFNVKVLEISILRITAILYVLKRSFFRNNLSLFLHCFWLFLIYRTTVKLIQVIIISLIIYSSSIVLWSFSVLNIKSPSSSSLNPDVVDFWLVCIIFIGSEFFWSRNVFLGVIENWQWDSSKLDIQILFHSRFV